MINFSKKIISIIFLLLISNNSFATTLTQPEISTKIEQAAEQLENNSSDKSNSILSNDFNYIVAFSIVGALQGILFSSLTAHLKKTLSLQTIAKGALKGAAFHAVYASTMCFINSLVTKIIEEMDDKVIEENSQEALKIRLTIFCAASASLIVTSLFYPNYK